MMSTPYLQSRRLATGLIWALLLLVGSEPRLEEIQPGSSLRAAGKSWRIRDFESPGYVENDYTRRFRFDRFENPKLTQLRSSHRLDEVVREGTDEFSRQIRLMDWTHHQFRKFGRPSISARGAIEILKGVEAGETFFCAQFVEVFISGSASLGWIARPLALRRHQGVNKVGGSTEHTTTEIWSNQFGKWVMMDPTSNLFVEKNGVPLNAYEIRQEWFYHQGTNLVFVVGKDRKRFLKQDLPIRLKSYPGFGELTFEPDEPDKYGFIGYIPNNDLMDSGYDYGSMFIFKDQLCDGTRWHVRKCPEDPAREPYFPINQAALKLEQRQDAIGIQLRTMTPNFERFEASFDGGEWQAVEARFPWPTSSGARELRVRSVNRFGVSGPVSRLRLEPAEH